MNERIKNITFVSAIITLIIIIFILGWICSANGNRIQRDEIKIQNLTGRVQSIETGYKNSLRESQSRLRIIESQRSDNLRLEERNNKFTKRTQELFRELERKDREIDRIRKERTEKNKIIDGKFKKVENAINELGKAINYFETSPMD